MSLVSALPERERSSYSTKQKKKQSSRTSSRTNSITSQNTLTSTESELSSSNNPRRLPAIYQTHGEPLSKEALYRAKMKYGYYQSPAAGTNVGLDDARASVDAAAALANVSHTNMETYVRHLDPNAARAASALGNKVVKNSTDRTQSITSVRTMPAPKRTKAGASAASKAYSMTSTSMSPYVEREGKTYSLQSSNMSSNANSSIVSSSSYRPPNMKGIYSSAEKNAGSSMSNRWDPERKNYSYGIKTQAAENNQFVFTKDVMGNIMNKNANTPNKKKLAEDEVKAAAKREKQARDALKAAVLVKDTNYAQDIDDELEAKKKNRQVYINQLTSSQVLAKARNTADAKLKRIDKDNLENNLYSNDAFNRAAVAIAQSNFKNKAQMFNKINMGGGLWLSPEDIQKISQDLVNPVLGEISARAESQRAADVEIAERTKDYNDALTGWKAIQAQKDSNDIKIVNDTTSRHERDKNDAKLANEQKYNAMVEKMEKRLQAKNKDLDATIQAYEDLKEEIAMNLDLEKEFADKELESWNKYREDDISAALTEQKELLKPYYDDLKKAEDEHDNLSKEYDNIGGEIGRLKKSIEDHKSKIDEYNGILETQCNREIRENEKLTKLTDDKTNLKTNLDDSIIVAAQKAREEASLSAKEARLKQLEVEASINERKTELSKTDIELQKEKLNLLEAMKHVAEARGDEKLDEDKIKTLFGMTSEEFIAKNMPEKKEVKLAENLSDAEEEVEKAGTVKKNLEKAKDETTEASNTPKKKASSKPATSATTTTTITSITPKKVSAATTSPTRKSATTVPSTTDKSPAKEEKRSSFLKGFFIGPARSNRTEPVRRATATKTAATKTAATKTAATKTAATKTAETTKPTSITKTPSKKSTSKTGKPVVKAASATVEGKAAVKSEPPADKIHEPKKEEQLDESSNELEPSFSGFSQGSITNNDEDLSIRNDGGAKDVDEQGYFKEVF